MANYVKATNFAVKDTLATGNPSKIVKGTEIDAELTAIASAISSKPDADSPTLTGTPLAPTATVATNNTQIATTAYVVNRITQDIAGKANIASPTFTGTPAAPTAAAGTNTTQLATTAFVKNAVDTAVGNVDSGVLTFSAGTTGLTPSTASAGAVVLAGKLNVINGGTGQESYTNGQLLIGNTTGNTLTKATLTAGTGISVTNGAGSITIAQSVFGLNAQVFASVVTGVNFTIPAGVTKLKVTVVGGGGGTTGSGGTSIVASGTQSITSISATGGAAVSGVGGGAGGIGSNGDLNIGGGAGSTGAYGIGFVSGGSGGNSILGGGGAPAVSGGAYGGGAGAQTGFNNCNLYQGNGGAGAGGAAIKWLSDLTPGNTLSVTVGAGGAGGFSGPVGASGVVIFEW